MSAARGRDDNTGTQDQPVRTLDRAINLALVTNRRVYACAERFEESVTIPSGVEVWGAVPRCARRRCTAGSSRLGRPASASSLLLGESVVVLRILTQRRRDAEAQKGERSGVILAAR